MTDTARLIALWGIAALLAGCGEPAGKEAVPQPRVQNGTVVFPAGSPQLEAIVSVAAEPRKEALLRFNGRLVWDENRTVRVFSPFGGRVQSIAVQAGEAVRSGQVLAWVASPELGQVQSDARKAEQDHALAAKNLARIEELHAAGVAPAKDLQVAQAEIARSAAERSRTAERLKLYGAAGGEVDQRFALRAPVSGVVVERNINPGQELRNDAPADKALFVVSDPAHLWFMLDVGEADVGLLKAGMNIRLSRSAPESERFTGRVTQIADFVDPQTRTVKVRGEVDNAERNLKAEMYVIARVRVPTTQGVLVPPKAVFLHGEQHFVFVDAGGGSFTRKRVRVGPLMEGMQVVLEGLAAGDKAVTDGNLLLERLVSAQE